MAGDTSRPRQNQPLGEDQLYRDVVGPIGETEGSQCGLIDRVDASPFSPQHIAKSASGYFTFTKSDLNISRISKVATTKL